VRYGIFPVGLKFDPDASAIHKIPQAEQQSIPNDVRRSPIRRDGTSSPKNPYL